MTTSKNTYRVGTDGTANYRNLSDIPDSVLAQGDNTILVYPGTYTAPTNIVLNDVAFVGVGDRDEIVISGAMTIANTSTGVATFENISFLGANAVTTSDSVCVSKLGAASAPLHFRNCSFSNAEHAVRHHATLAFATTTRQVELNYCDASAVDQAVVANANVGINWSAMNAGANAYFTPGGGAGVPVVTVRASTSAGSNTGNTVETVLALIS
jgi:hypothetical protein